MKHEGQIHGGVGSCQFCAEGMCFLSKGKHTTRERRLCAAKCTNTALWHIHQPNVHHKVKCIFIEALHYEEQTLLKCWFFFLLTLVLSWWNHTTFHNRIPTPKRSGKICQLFPNCSCIAIPSLAKYFSIEITSLRIMQDHPHPPPTRAR